jgi:hypothetical protein
MKKVILAAVAAAVVVLGASAVKAGRVGGKGESTKTVPGSTTIVYTEFFRAGELATVQVRGDGGTDLDLYVYDEFGNEIAKDIGPTDKCYASWRPRWTGKFTIKVVNRGWRANRYAIWTN